MKVLLFIFITVLASPLLAQNSVNPKLYSKDLKLANLAFETEDYITAINTYKKVLAINPNQETANLNSIISRIKLNQAPDSSLQYLSKLKHSTSPEVQFYFGRIYHQTSNFEEALKCYNTYKKTFLQKSEVLPTKNLIIICRVVKMQLI